MSDNTEMELIGTALQNFDRVSAGLALLEKNYKGMLYDVETSMGMEHAKAARAAIREPRYEVERLRKGAKAPILALGKRLDAEATRISNALLTLETPIDEQIKSEETRKEQEKLAKAASEAARIADIQRRIDNIRSWPVTAAGKSSVIVQQMLEAARDSKPDETFQEFLEAAQTAWTTSGQALSGILADRQAQEAEQERIKAERIELDKLRAEQAERAKAQAAEQAKADAIAREKLLAEARLHAEELGKQRIENERIARERKDEFDRQAEEQRTAHAVETARIAAERAELERQQAELRKASEPKPKRKAVQNPGRAAIVQALADHYSVDGSMIRRWLKEIDWESEAA